MAAAADYRAGLSCCRDARLFRTALFGRIDERRIAGSALDLLSKLRCCRTGTKQCHLDLVYSGHHAEAERRISEQARPVSQAARILSPGSAVISPRSSTEYMQRAAARPLVFELRPDADRLCLYEPGQRAPTPVARSLAAEYLRCPGDCAYGTERSDAACYRRLDSLYELRHQPGAISPLRASHRLTRRRYLRAAACRRPVLARQHLYCCCCPWTQSAHHVYRALLQ